MQLGETLKPKVAFADAAGVAANVQSLVAAAAGIPWDSPAENLIAFDHFYSVSNIVAAIYQDDDAHDTCSLTACLNPLHPGPCKGWKGTLHEVSPGAWHALEAARVEKANHNRIKKIEALKAQGKPIPHKLLQPILPKAHPNAGQTANKATGEAHAAGKAISEASGIKNNHPGKVTLGMAVKKPVELGPKGKKPTVASKGIAAVIAQEKVTPQYKLDKAATITPEQWNALTDDEKSVIRGELSKISIHGFGPQQEKANQLLAKLPAHEPTAAEKAQAANEAHQKAAYEAAKAAAPLKKPTLADTLKSAPPVVKEMHEPTKTSATKPTAADAKAPASTAAHHTPKFPGEPLSAKNYTPAMKDATDAAGNFVNPPKIHALQMTFADRFKAYQKINAEEWKALPDGTKTAIVHDMIGAAAGDKQLHQGFIDESGKAYTPASAWLKRRNIELPALDQGKIDKFVPQFSKGKPTKPTVQIVIPERTTVEAKNIFGEHSQITKVTHPGTAKPETATTPATKLAESKPKPLPKHVEAAVAMAKGHAPGASWSKNHLAAYQPLSAEEFHALPKDVQDKIVSELTKGKSKFLDPKKVKAAEDLLTKFGKGGGPKVAAPKIENVDFGTHLHDHNVTATQAKEAVADASIASHFKAAKQTAGLTNLENPDAHGYHEDLAGAAAEAMVDKATKLYDEDSGILAHPGVHAAVEALAHAAHDQAYAQSVGEAKAKAYNKISTTLAKDTGQLSPIEKASLQHYQKHLASHPVKTDTATLDHLKATTKQAEADLTTKLHAAVKAMNAPKPENMTPAQVADRAKELLGPDAHQTKFQPNLAEFQHNLVEGKKTAAAEAAAYPPELLNSPAVGAKYEALVQTAAGVNNAQTLGDKFSEHMKENHLKALTSKLDVNGNSLSQDDSTVISKHASQLNDLVGGSQAIATAKAKYEDALTQFKAAADKAKASAKPAEPNKLTDFDQEAISNAFQTAWAQQVNKTVLYGVKTFAQKQQMKAHPEYEPFTHDLGNLKVLAAKVALAHAHEHTAGLNVPTDPDTGAMEFGPEHDAWLKAIAQREDLESQFNILHKQAQAKLDAIRTSVGLKKRALPKVDAPAVKAGAAESGYYKSKTSVGPNFNKATSAKSYILAKVGPKLGVVHKTSIDKANEKYAKKTLGDVSAPSASTPAASTSAGPGTKLGKAAGVQVKLTSEEAEDDIVAHVPDPVKQTITSAFKGMPSGKYLADPAADIFDNLVNLAAAHGGEVPYGLSVGQVINIIDETHSQNLGVKNTGMLSKKIHEWLATSDGKAYAESHSVADSKTVKKLAGEIDLPAGVTLAPGEKVQKVAGPGPHDESIPSSAFKAASSTQAQAAQDAFMKAQKIKWTPTQKSALKSYTGSAYHMYNGYLRGTKTGGPDTKQNVVDIQSAMIPLSQHTLLKRGTGWDALPAEFHGDNASKLVGKTFQEPGFTSTTVAGESGHFGGPLELEIEAPIGTPAAFVNGISHYKNKENEMLLAAGTKFKVLSVTKKGHQTVMRVRIVGDK